FPGTPARAAGRRLGVRYLGCLDAARRSVFLFLSQRARATAAAALAARPILRAAALPVIRRAKRRCAATRKNPDRAASALRQRAADPGEPRESQRSRATAAADGSESHRQRR